MRKVYLAIVALVVCVAGLSAQSLYDPYSTIYRDLDIWAGRGYIDSLPPVRPYPPQLVEELLTSVMERGDGPSADAAAAYYHALLPGARPVLKGGVTGVGDTVVPVIRAGLAADFAIEDWLAVSLAYDAWALKQAVGEETLVPGVYSPYPDMVNDTSNIGSFIVLQNYNAVMSVGSGSLYFQAGLNRGSFGPFPDNGIVLGSQAPHAGHFSLVYRGHRWTASMLYLALSASNQFGTDRYPNKHMVLHSFDFMVLPGLELGFFESVIYGDRFETLYLAPFNFLFQAQGVAGFYDNSLLGLHGTWRVSPDIKLMCQVYVDDIGFNDLAKLRFDTKYKFAGQAGLAWTPVSGPLSSLELDYTAIMPYMYTHNGNLSAADFANEDPSTANAKPIYSNYLHMGKSLGADLLPNSDRLSIRTLWYLFPLTKLRLGAEFMHHGNASSNSGISNDTTFNNGDYHDDGRDDNGNATFQDTTRFLTQSLLETTLRGSLGLEFALPTKLGRFALDADVVLEYGWNRGLVSGDCGLSVLYSISASWSL
ncbi:MAG TPA: hypothetical protein PLC54_03280, partial [Spirochaetales bacterium]|nr:hypothetical protein [Spirochaetales bacterium]